MNNKNLKTSCLPEISYKHFCSVCIPEVECIGLKLSMCGSQWTAQVSTFSSSTKKVPGIKLGPSAMIASIFTHEIISLLLQIAFK